MRIRLDKKTFGTAYSNMKKQLIRETSCVTAGACKSGTTDVIHLSRNGFVDFSQYSPEINAKFREFISVIKQRKPELLTDNSKYSKFLKYIFENPNYTSEKDLLTHLTYLTQLAGKKSPSGRYLLDGKTFKYLADFKGNGLSKQQLRDYGTLIGCAEQGLIPISAMEKFSIANGVNPQLLGDVEKLKFAKSKGLNPIDVFIPEFESAIKNADEISKLKPGDFFSTKRGYSGTPEVYYITTKHGLLSMGNIDREILFEIMPPVKRFFVRQGYSGTCYQLAAYMSMLQEPKFMSKLLRISRRDGKLMIQMPGGSTPNNLFAGKLEEFSSTGCVRTYLDDAGQFIPADFSQSATSNSLIKAMESLYGKHRKYTYADEFVKYVDRTYGKDKAKRVYQEALQNIDKYIYIKDDKSGKFTVKTLEQINREQIKKGKKTFKVVEDYYKESGEVEEIYNYFNQGCNSVSRYHSGGNNSVQTLDEMRNILQTPDSVHMFGTLPEANGIKGFLNKRKDLHTGHAYCIQNYNPKTDVVTYVNPWNSALTYEMKLEELAKYIDDIGSLS